MWTRGIVRCQREWFSPSWTSQPPARTMWSGRVFVWKPIWEHVMRAESKSFDGPSYSSS